jgi:hypothetical protein
MSADRFLEPGSSLAIGNRHFQIGELNEALARPEDHYGHPQFLTNAILRNQELYRHAARSIGVDINYQTTRDEVEHTVNGWFDPIVGSRERGPVFYQAFDMYELIPGALIPSHIPEGERNRTVVMEDVPYATYAGRFLWGKTTTGKGIQGQAVFLITHYTRTWKDPFYHGRVESAFHGKIYKGDQFARQFNRLSAQIGIVNVAFNMSRATGGYRG